MSSPASVNHDQKHMTAPSPAFTNHDQKQTTEPASTSDDQKQTLSPPARATIRSALSIPTSFDCARARRYQQTRFGHASRPVPNLLLILPCVPRRPRPCRRYLSAPTTVQTAHTATRPRDRMHFPAPPSLRQEKCWKFLRGDDRSSCACVCVCVRACVCVCITGALGVARDKDKARQRLLARRKVSVLSVGPHARNPHAL